MDKDKRKILIVDDDTFLIDMYALKFSQGSFEVYTAPGAKEAILKIQGGLNPDIILLDIMMPEMDGFEMLEKINEAKIATNAIKIILSNKGQQADIDRGNQLGASGYIIKATSTPAEVIDKVMEIIAKKALA